MLFHDNLLDLCLILHDIHLKIYENKPNNLWDLIDKLENGDLKKSKNIVFTFSRIFDGLTDNDNDFSIRIIDKKDSEKAINEFIDKFYRSNKKIMVIQLKEYFIEHLNHIQTLIDNYTKNIHQEIENTNNYQNETNIIDTTKNKEKYIILIIHLKREVFYGFENKNKEKNYISHLSPYNQIFIDNLRGENLSITKFYNLKNEVLYNKDDDNEITIFKKENEFSDLIYQGFMRFSYKFLNEYIPDEEDLKEDNKDFKITETNYHEKATESLKYDKKRGNKYLNSIQKRIIEIICEKNKKNIIEEIIRDSDYQQKGIDFISDIRNYMRELLLKYFIKFIYKSEKDAVLPTILFPINKNENVDENMINYINNLDFGDENPSYDIRANTVNIIFGLNLPLIYPYLFNMRDFAYSMKKDYLNYELKQRFNNIKEEEMDKKNELIKNMQNQFNENNLFKKENEKISEKEMKIFYQDFRKIFIFENMKLEKNLEEILEIIMEIKFGELLNKYDKIGEVFLWVESYIHFIIDILKFCLELKFDLNEFKDEVSEQVENKRTNASVEQFDIINTSEPFYTIIEYLCTYCIKNSNLFNEKIGILDYCCELLIQDIQEYYITSRIIFILKSCIEVYKNWSDNSQFNNYLEEVKKEIDNLKKKNIEDLKLNWENEFEFIKNDIPNNSDNIISLFILKFR